MNKITASFIFCALTLLLLSAACGPAPASPTMEQPTAADAASATPAATDTPAASNPVTGQDITTEARFCVGQTAYAVELIREGLTYTAADNACTSVETMNGLQVVLCHGASLTSVDLQICSSPDTCLPVRVDLGQCPYPTLTPTAAATGTPTSTSIPEASPTASTETETATATP